MRNGQDHRLIPLWGELLPFLETHWDQAGDDVYVINNIARLPQSTRDESERYSKNAGTQFKRLIKQAGFEPWSGPWKALRSSRENELELTQKFRPVAIRTWIGHSQAVAERHYLEVTESDFKAACSGGQMVGTDSMQAAATGPQQPTTNNKNAVLHEAAVSCSNVQDGNAPGFRRHLARLSDLSESLHFLITMGLISTHGFHTPPRNSPSTGTPYCHGFRSIDLSWGYPDTAKTLQNPRLEPRLSHIRTVVSITGQSNDFPVWAMRHW